MRLNYAYFRLELSSKYQTIEKKITLIVKSKLKSDLNFLLKKKLNVGKQSIFFFQKTSLSTKIDKTKENLINAYITSRLYKLYIEISIRSIFNLKAKFWKIYLKSIIYLINLTFRLRDKRKTSSLLRNSTI